MNSRGLSAARTRAIYLKLTKQIEKQKSLSQKQKLWNDFQTQLEEILGASKQALLNLSNVHLFKFFKEFSGRDLAKALSSVGVDNPLSYQENMVSISEQGLNNREESLLEYHNPESVPGLTNL